MVIDSTVLPRRDGRFITHQTTSSPIGMVIHAHQPTICWRIAAMPSTNTPDTPAYQLSHSGQDLAPAED